MSDSSPYIDVIAALKGQQHISLAQPLFQPYILVRSVLVSSCLTLLQFPEFHPASTTLTFFAQGLLTNSALTSTAFLIGVAFLQQVSALIGEMRRHAPVRDEEEGPN